KLSQFTKVLATPEEYFENLIKSTLNIEIPPGPQSMLLKLQASIEAGEAPSIEKLLPKAPRIESILARFPKLPELPAETVRAEVPQAPKEEKKEKPITF
ncbi:MAG: hypothetical protein QXW40_06180, partial [Thermofilum sp.]